MKLTELNPRWVGVGGEGISDRNGNPVQRRDGIGVTFDCPCRICGIALYIRFTNPLDEGSKLSEEEYGPAWERTGETFETLTLRPSILRSKDKGGCGWHGFVTNGEVTGT